MYRVTQQGEQLRQTQLTNYQAAIKKNVMLDDGIDARREFEVEAELLSRKFTFTVPASEFPSMDWAIAHMGPAAITFPGQKEYARTAIQSFSMMAKEQCIYTHTGWRSVGNQWVFLHAGGAIGRAGAVAEIELRLPGTLSRFELQIPADDVVAQAVRSSLHLAELGPPSISFPLLAGTYRAVFGDADFALHLSGETGTFKSELAALHQRHFGAGMDRLHLPGAWASTGNALEMSAFHAKDTLFVIDDFAPQGSAADVARYHASAERVFRAAGNRAGRARLDSSAKLREPKPPRGLVLSTGEDVPRGHSVRARLLILEIGRGAIVPDELTKCQAEAQAGLYAASMGAFVRWIASDYNAAGERFKRRRQDLHLCALRNIAHARTPEIVANLQAGFEVYLEFAVERAGLTSGDRDRLAARCWEALRECAAAQARYHAGTEPTAMFLATVRALLTSGRAYLEERKGGAPERAAGSCGWRRLNDSWVAQGDRIGWVDGDDVYLEPTATYRLVQIAGRDSGDILPITEQTLRRRLRAKGLLASVDLKRETLTVRRTIAGASKDVLHMQRGTLLPEEPEAAEGEGETLIGAPADTCRVATSGF